MLPGNTLQRNSNGDLNVQYRTAHYCSVHTYARAHIRTHTHTYTRTFTHTGEKVEGERTSQHLPSDDRVHRSVAYLRTHHRVDS